MAKAVSGGISSSRKIQRPRARAARRSLCRSLWLCQPPETTGLGGFMDQLKYINRTSPEAFMQLGAGLMAGDPRVVFRCRPGTGASAARAAQAGSAGAAGQSDPAVAAGQGLDEATADAAMANPDILASLLKRAEGGTAQNKFAPVLMKRPDGSFYYASPNPETGQLDPYTMATGDVPVDPGSKAGMIESAKVTAKGSSEARVMLVDAKMQQQDVRVMSQSVLNDPYLDKMFGEIDMTDGWFSKADLPNISPDSSRVMGKLKRLMGQSFLQARQLLKGGGPITDYEGNKADQAYSTIAYAKTVPDLKAAIQEFQYWVDRGVQKLQAQANVGEYAGGWQRA